MERITDKKIKNIILESAKFVRQKDSIDVRHDFGFKKMLVNDDAFVDYRDSLLEQFNINDSELRSEMEMIFDNTRDAILEMSSQYLNPYESLILPMIPIFYPKLAAREAVTTTPIDKPDVIRTFLISRFITQDGSVYEGPVDKADDINVSGEPQIGVASAAYMDVPSTFDVLNVMSLDPSVAHLSKVFKIVKVFDGLAGAGNSADVAISCTVDGNFAAQVTVNSVDDFITGKVDFKNGIVRIASLTGVVKSVAYQAQISLEENTINTYTELDVIKSRITVQDNVLSTKWSSQLQKDIRSFFNIDFQSQVLSIMGNQINIDIDRRIFKELLYTGLNLNGPEFQDTFSTTPSAGYVLGEKSWLNTIVPKIERLSGVIADATNIAEASVLVCNPRDHWIFKSLDEYGYDGSVMTGGNYGPIGGRVGNKYKILVSKNVPKGKLLILMKEPEEMRATFFFAPYVPGLLTPFPIGATPSMTAMSRNGQLLVRGKGIAVLNITST